MRRLTGDQEISQRIPSLLPGESGLRITSQRATIRPVRGIRQEGDTRTPVIRSVLGPAFELGSFQAGTESLHRVECVRSAKGKHN